MNKLNQGGFSLIEVLVAILVLALGVIGVAGMQLTALRASQQSAFQTAAVQLASEMADRIRANDNQMKLDDDANPFLAVDYKSDVEPDAPPALCYAATCNGEELAKFDIYEWEKRVKATLPGGRALICRDSSPWDTTTGALTWKCSGGAGSSTSLVVKLGWQAKGKNPDGSSIIDSSKPVPPSVAITIEPYIK
jgi:type IV pilus assembly protein PilV